MTLLQNKLGRFYKYIYLLKFAFKKGSGGILSVLLFQLGGMINIFGIVGVWIISNDPSKYQSLATVFSFLLIGRLMYSLVDGMYHIGVSSDINSGRLSNQLLLPTPYHLWALGKDTGFKLFQISTTIFGNILTIIIFSKFINLNFEWGRNFWFTAGLLPLMYVIRLIIGWIIGYLAFFTKNKRDMDGIHFSIIMSLFYFVGTYLPIYKIIERFPFMSFLEYLPTAFLIHHPMKIYSNLYSNDQILLTYLGALGWALILWITAKIVFKLGLKQYESVGL